MKSLSSSSLIQILKISLYESHDHLLHCPVMMGSKCSFGDGWFLPSHRAPVGTGSVGSYCSLGLALPCRRLRLCLRLKTRIDGETAVVDAVETVAGVVEFDVVEFEEELGNIPDLSEASHHRLNSYTVLHILKSILDKMPLWLQFVDQALLHVLVTSLAEGYCQ